MRQPRPLFFFSCAVVAFIAARAPGALAQGGLRAAPQDEALATPAARALGECSWSACTAACEAADARTFAGTGVEADCPAATACAGGDGACAKEAGTIASPGATGGGGEDDDEGLDGMGYFVIVFVSIAGLVTLWAFIFPHADHPGICGLFAVIDKDGDGDLSCLEILRFIWDVLAGYCLVIFCTWWNKKIDKERMRMGSGPPPGKGPPGSQPVEMMPSPTSAAAVAAEG